MTFVISRRMKTLLRVIITFLFRSAVEGIIPLNGYCTENMCFTITQSNTDFQTSLEECSRNQGHLITVKSSSFNNAMRNLLHRSTVKGNFWIGSQLASAEKKITEENNALLSPPCVSVSINLKLTERPCTETINGFICEYKYEGMCERLITKKENTISYSTPLGISGERFDALPPGSIATGSASGFKMICSPGLYQWLPCNCENEKGACEDYCVMDGLIPARSCESGYEMVNGDCTKIDGCRLAPCEHHCVNTPDGYNCSCKPGYIQSRVDRRKCDMHCDSEKCKALCIDNNKSCRCPEGFILDLLAYCVRYDNSTSTIVSGHASSGSPERIIEVTVFIIISSFALNTFLT